MGNRRGRGEVLRFSSGGGVEAPACGRNPLIIPAPTVRCCATRRHTRIHANMHEHPHACGSTSNGTNTEGPAPISPKHARQSIKHVHIHPIKPSIFHVSPFMSDPLSVPTLRSRVRILQTTQQKTKAEGGSTQKHGRKTVNRSQTEAHSKRKFPKTITITVPVISKI